MAAVLRRSLCRGVRNFMFGTHGVLQPVACSQVEFADGSTALHTLAYSHAPSGCLSKLPFSSENVVQPPAVRCLQHFRWSAGYSTNVNERRQIFYPTPQVFIGQPAPEFTAPGKLLCFFLKLHRIETYNCEGYEWLE